MQCRQSYLGKYQVGSYPGKCPVSGWEDSSFSLHWQALADRIFTGESPRKPIVFANEAEMPILQLLPKSREDTV